MNTYKSKFTLNESPVYVSDNLTAKMDGIPAISTSVILNPYCQQRAKNPDTICAHCFAIATVNRYSALSKHLEENTAVLTGRILEPSELPVFGYNVGMVRFEAFGDLSNAIQAINYFNIANASKHVHFALWTKNPRFIADAIKQGYEKPENLQIVYSSPMLNEKVNADKLMKIYPFIDKVFTVYDKATIAKENIDINCGGRSCKGCGTCYFDKLVKEIREQLK